MAATSLTRFPAARLMFQRRNRAGTEVLLAAARRLEAMQAAPSRPGGRARPGPDDPTRQVIMRRSLALPPHRRSSPRRSGPRARLVAEQDNPTTSTAAWISIAARAGRYWSSRPQPSMHRRATALTIIPAARCPVPRQSSERVRTDRSHPAVATGDPRSSVTDVPERDRPDRRLGALSGSAQRREWRRADHSFCPAARGWQLQASSGATAAGCPRGWSASCRDG